MIETPLAVDIAGVTWKVFVAYTIRKTDTAVGREFAWEFSVKFNTFLQVISFDILKKSLMYYSQLF